MNVNDSVTFQVIEWWAQDEEIDDLEDENEDLEEQKKCKEEYIIRCFGKTKNGELVKTKIKNFKPFYYIKVNDDFNKVQLKKFLDYVKNHFSLKKKIDDLWVPYYNNTLEVDKCEIISKKDLYGFTNNKTFKFVKLVFSNYTAMMKSRYIFKNAIQIPFVNTCKKKYKLYESNFEPFLRFCHIKDVLTAGWITLEKGRYYLNDFNEYEISYENVKSERDIKDMAKFLQVSWDIEVYSYDYSFPDPKYEKNVIFNIGTVYKYYGENETFKKYLFTLKNTLPINETIIIKCENERDLIEKWVKNIQEHDPDILYSYNGDSFDFKYLIERSKKYGDIFERKILQALSRVDNVPSYIKREYFSSSAYGDNEFYRMYIPGRLNYDLLIHYKRGMKKYASYKLENISQEILKEGKHDVSAKEIFKFYEDGSPEKMKLIGDYCVQDCALLQKLVDKQLILTNIIQLANVTYVPIGFLVTKGQTIKVYSQLLRKARQMNFLVPHTNFNEDIFPIVVKFTNKHNIDDTNIDEYVEIGITSQFKKIQCKVKENNIIELEQNFQDNFSRQISINNEKYTCKKIDEKSISLSAGEFVNGSKIGIEVEHYIKGLKGKICEVIDENTIVIMSDTELNQPQYIKTTLKHFHNRVTYEYPVCKLSPSEESVEDSFTGATVLEPSPGIYYDNIAVLDFASLYPTIMISRNLCYSTFIMDSSYNNIKGVNYENISWNDTTEYKLKHTCVGVGKSGKSKGMICGKQAFYECTEGNSIQYYCRVHDPYKKNRQESEKTLKKDVSYDYTIVQPHIDESGVKQNVGVLPALLVELYSERKKVKKQMNEAILSGNKLLADILDSTQLAIKISLNSTYGFLGRGRGNLILKELGSIVTSVGRKLIEESKEYAEGEFLEYVKENKLLNHVVKCKNLNNILPEDKYKILKKHKVN